MLRLCASVLLVAFAQGEVRAAPVCSNTPGTGNHIECEESETSTNNIDIDAMGIDIDLTGTGTTTAGVRATHLGSGDVDISIAGITTGMTTTRSMIDTTGRVTHGVWAHLSGEGTLTFTLEDTGIRTQDTTSWGLVAQHRGNGHIEVDLRSGVTIDTAGIGVRIAQENYTADQVNNITLLTQGISVTTTGNRSHGLFALREGGPGDVHMTLRDTIIMTGGDIGYAIISQHSGTGDHAINLVCTDSPAVPCSITTRGTQGHGVLSWHHASSSGEGRIDIKGDYAITTESVGLISQDNAITSAHGIYGLHQGTGDVHVDTQGTITTAGTHSYGIYGLHFGSGNVNLATGANNRITTTGPNGHGIVAYHRGTAAGRSMDVTVGGRIDVSGAGARGVQVGAVSNNMPVRTASLDALGYREQTVTVNGAINSAAESVYLAGGGKVIIGPQGSISSGSGIAILATGTVA